MRGQSLTVTEDAAEAFASFENAHNAAMGAGVYYASSPQGSMTYNAAALMGKACITT